LGRNKTKTYIVSTGLREAECECELSMSGWDTILWM